MAESGEKNLKKTVIQLCIGFFIAAAVASVSYISKTTGFLNFYEEIELTLYDQHFKIRGPIQMDQNLGTIDIDALSLEHEGRYQDWTRDKYANLIRTLKELDTRMIGFDVFFPEYSEPGLLKKEDLDAAGVQTVEEVMNMFRDYDSEMVAAMEETGIALIGQSMIESDRYDAEWLEKNTAEKSAKTVEALEALAPYSQKFPLWKESGLPFYMDIEHPITPIIKASNGVGYAMTVADMDGSVRHYPVVLIYDGKLWPSLALMMYLEYIGRDFSEVRVEGKMVIVPPGTLPDGREMSELTIPLNDDGLMMVNWTGDYGDSDFFHVPHISVLLNVETWKTASVEKQIKRVLLDNPGFVTDAEGTMNDPGPVMQALTERGVEIDDRVIVNFPWQLMCADIERRYINGDETYAGEVPGIWPYLIEQAEFESAMAEVSNNHKIAGFLEKYPDLTLDEMADSINVHPADRIRLGFYVLKDKFAKGGLKPEDYPLYFSDPELNGRIITAEDFKDKVFIYGLTAAGTWDLNPMPYSNRYPMLGLYANIVNMFLHNDFLRRVPVTVNVLFVLLLGLLMGIVVPKIKPLWGALMTLGLLIIVAFGAQYLFESHGIWIDEFGPFLVILVGYTAITVYNFFSEEKEKKMIRGIFSRYVTKSVVDELIKNPDMVKLGGERKELTVFFSDVAGFTNISEQLEPEELVALLNDYLTEMSNIILKYDGMIDKYEGDAIMAVFGTPVMYPDHATRACYVSLEMQEKLVEMRKRWKEEGNPELEVRIGLNTGAMIAGNMGAADRLDYTVMGDSVNLGSRLEGANKAYNTYMMISEFTYAAAKDDVEVRLLDSLRVKGKKEPVKVYELLGRKDNGLSQEMVNVREHYMAGIEKYLQREWDAGIECFEKALEIISDDGPSKVYIDRIQAYKVNPPPPDWDGVFTMTTK